MQLELRGVEVLEHPAEVLKPRYGNVSDIGLAVAQRVVHSAFDGVEASFLGRPQRELRLFAERDAALREELLERREDDGEGKLVGMCVRLVLLGGAGPEEHDLRVVAVLLLDETAVCAHGRGKGRNEFRVSGQVFSHHVHRGRAGGRNDERRVGLGEEL